MTLKIQQLKQKQNRLSKKKWEEVTVRHYTALLSDWAYKQGCDKGNKSANGRINFIVKVQRLNRNAGHCLYWSSSCSIRVNVFDSVIFAVGQGEGEIAAELDLSAANTVFVKNLNFETNDDTLYNFFETCGTIRYAFLKWHRNNFSIVMIKNGTQFNVVIY